MHRMCSVYVCMQHLLLGSLWLYFYGPLGDVQWHYFPTALEQLLLWSA